MGKDKTLKGSVMDDTKENREAMGEGVEQLCQQVKEATAVVAVMVNEKEGTTGIAIVGVWSPQILIFMLEGLRSAQADVSKHGIEMALDNLPAGVRDGIEAMLQNLKGSKPTDNPVEGNETVH